MAEHVPYEQVMAEITKANVGPLGLPAATQRELKVRHPGGRRGGVAWRDPDRRAQATAAPDGMGGGFDRDQTRF